jgi:hypothetical protein
MIVIVDVDGTVALRNSRGPFEWEKLDTDIPNSPIIELIEILHKSGHEIVFMSGRHEGIRNETEKWLSSNIGFSFSLIMRPNGDSRSDEIVKAELFNSNFSDRSQVFLVIDDRDRVVRMWREQFGLTCLQVASGNF